MYIVTNLDQPILSTLSDLKFFPALNCSFWSGYQSPWGWEYTGWWVSLSDRFFLPCCGSESNCNSHIFPTENGSIR